MTLDRAFRGLPIVELGRQAKGSSYLMTTGIPMRDVRTESD
jgi:hypothetical protein